MISLQDYLKKYSTVNNQFIDDFFGLYDNKTKTSDYVLDLNVISKWLKSRKETLKETLTNTYTKNLDYKIKKGKSTGGRPSEIILLTPDCFKRLCMLSKTKKAEEVRTYFLEIEKHIDKYKDYVIEALNKKVGVLSNNQKKIDDPKSGIIYIMKTDLDIEGIYKIGKTKKFKERLATHNSSHVDNVDVILIYESHDIDSVEKCLKLSLKSKQYRKRKEFYETDIDQIKELLDDCETLMLKGKRKPKNKLSENDKFYVMVKRNDDNNCDSEGEKPVKVSKKKVIGEKK